jgi:hypothetical protein
MGHADKSFPHFSHVSISRCTTRSPVPGCQGISRRDLVSVAAYFMPLWPFATDIFLEFDSTFSSVPTDLHFVKYNH